MSSPPDKPQPPKKQPAKISLSQWMKYYPAEGGDPYYRNIQHPLEFVLLVMKDERRHLKTRYEAALAAMPYLVSKPSAKPYIPTAEEMKDAEERRRLVVEVVDYAECQDDYEEGSGS